jgi:hypothetical protein
MVHTLRLFFTHFTIKRTQRIAFEKNACSKNKTEQNTEGSAISLKYILLDDLLKNLALK